jgi:hypothetical protein
MNTTEIPRWVLLLVSNALIIFLIIAFCIIFAYKQSIVGIGQPCLIDGDCNAFVGLKCTAGTCSCSAVQYWNNLQLQK